MASVDGEILTTDEMVEYEIPRLYIEIECAAQDRANAQAKASTAQDSVDSLQLDIDQAQDDYDAAVVALGEAVGEENIEAAQAVVDAAVLELEGKQKLQELAQTDFDNAVLDLTASNSRENDADSLITIALGEGYEPSSVVSPAALRAYDDIVR